MTTKHDENHAELLARLFTEDAGPPDPETLATIEACPVCRAEYEAMREALALLDDAAGHERATFAEAEALESAPGDAQVERVLADLLTERRSPAWRRLTSSLALVAAGIAVLVLFGPFGGDEPEPTGPPVLLGDEDELECLAPLGEVEAYGPFLWSGVLDEGQDFEVRVWPEGEVGLGRPLLESGSLTERAWGPDPAELSALPPAIEWEVHILDEFGGSRMAASGRASLR